MNRMPPLMRWYRSYRVHPRAGKQALTLVGVAELAHEISLKGNPKVL
jgi:hypothetical protein